MFQTIVYYISLFRLKLFAKDYKRNRYELVSPFALPSEPEKLGIVLSKEVIDVATPQLEVEENLIIFGSNTFDKTALKVDLKWRPDAESELVTLKTQFSLEINNETLDFEELLTYVPKRDASFKNAFVQYGGNLSKLRVYVIDPLLNYRLCFAGYMTVRGEPSKKRYVSLNLLLKASSKVYDFKSSFDDSFVAAQFASKPHKMGLFGSLNTLIRQDRGENLCQLKGQITIDKTSKSTRLFWGFYCRHFLDDNNTQKLRSKRIIGMFDSGKAFHLSSVETIDSNFDKSQRVLNGYTYLHGVRIYPDDLQIYNDDSPDWDKVSSESSELNFKILTLNSSLKVEAKRRSSASAFFDMNGEGRLGWLMIFVNDTLDTDGEKLQFRRSLENYLQSLKDGKLLRQAALEFDLELESNKPLVVNIMEENCAYQELVGPKAASLALLHKMSKVSTTSYSVPKAVVLTKFAYQSFVSSNEDVCDEVKQLGGLVSIGSIDLLANQCDKIQGIVTSLSTKVPSSVETALWDQLKSLFSISDIQDSLDGRQFAVRSSSWGEDEEGMSAAGQLTTVLNVSGRNNLISAIKTCFASKFSYTNIEYKRQHGLPLDMPMAVVIQEMVECDKAGVLFTCEPTGDRRFFTLTANYGLGESVVSGVANPDSIKVEVGDNLDLEIIVEKVIGKKEVIISGQNKIDQQVAASHSISSFSDDSGLEKTVVVGAGSEVTTVENADSSFVELELKEEKPEAVKTIDSKKIIPTSNLKDKQFDKSKCCLEDSEILKLVRCGKEQTNYFQSLRDIEFGFKDGCMFMLQSRPVTSIDSFSEYEILHEFDTATRGEVEYISRANIGEVMPYAATPIFLTYNFKNWMLVGSQLFLKDGRMNMKEYASTITNAMKVEMYHSFFSLRDNEIFLGNSSQKNLLKKAMEISMFGHEVNEPGLAEACLETYKALPKYQKLWAYYYSMSYRWCPVWKIKKTQKIVERMSIEVKSGRLTRNKSARELLHNEMFFKNLADPWINHFSIIFVGTEANFILLMKLAEYTQDPVQLFTALSKVLAASPDILSAEIPARIEKMSNMIRERGANEASSFGKMSNLEAIRYINNYDKLAKEFDIFMQKFGHRAYNEFDPRSKPWEDNPDEIIEKIKLNCLAEQTKGKSKQKNIDQVIDSIGFKFSFKDRMLLKYSLIPRSQIYVTLREQTKDGIVKCSHLMRLILRKLAQELRQMNRIPDDDLLNFFKYYEIERLIEAPQPALVMQALKRRRLYDTKFDIEWRFDEIEVGHTFLPSHLKQSVELSKDLLSKPQLTGTTACCGTTKGKVCIVNSYKELNKVKANHILVVHSTDIAFSPVFPIIAGLITEVGGLISHGAVVAREYGVPCIIGVESATKILKDGEEIMLDADNGRVVRVSLE